MRERADPVTVRAKREWMDMKTMENNEHGRTIHMRESILVCRVCGITKLEMRPATNL